MSCSDVYWAGTDDGVPSWSVDVAPWVRRTGAGHVHAALWVRPADICHTHKHTAMTYTHAYSIYQYTSTLHQLNIHVRLTPGTPAHNALHCQVGLASGRSLGGDWRRRPGRPRARWTDQLCNDTGSVPANHWRQAILRGHGGATRRPELATRWPRRRRHACYCDMSVAHTFVL